MRTPNRIRSIRSALAAGAGALVLGGAAAAVGAPVISGADTDVWNAANPDAAYTITASSRRSPIFWVIPGVVSGDGRSPMQVRPRDLPDGSYRLVAVEGFDVEEDQVAIRSFRVDTTPPVVTIRRPVAGEVLDRRAAVAADYACEGAVVCAGPVAAGARLDLSTLGPQAFRVSAVNDAGNETIGLVNYVVRPPAVVAAARPATRNARALRPRPGERVTSRRPALRWRGHPQARLYNVQLFRLRGTAATKVLSAFPRRARLRVPAGKIVFGARYAWRIWPYLADGYTQKPLGLSYFDVRRPRTGR